ncbi:MAG: peptidoglycan bridge formation glycyltransferase FemA/FemB family protein, partial [Rubrivivax sp.]|nr:peptidoglycan bridge formation glycyltransferase FemA/FemB family protein [Rubrivivax sp.]
LRLAVFDAGGSIQGACQILFRPLPLGRCLGYAPRGPIVDLESTDGAAARAVLFDGVEAACRARRAIALKLDPCLPAGADRFLRLCGARPARGLEAEVGGTQPKYVMRLDLRPGLEAVFGGFKPEYRNRIRKAEKRGIMVRHAATDADWQSFDELLRQTARRQQFAVRAKGYFDAIREELRGACQATVLLGELNGAAVGAILLIAYGQTCWYLYGGMSDAGRQHYSGYLLQWQAMQWAVERGCTTYDFRGVAAPDATDSPLYGLNKFKGGFGPELVEWVGEFDLVLAPLPYRLFEVALPRVRALLKRRAR